MRESLSLGTAAAPCEQCQHPGRHLAECSRWHAQAERCLQGQRPHRASTFGMQVINPIRLNSAGRSRWHSQAGRRAQGQRHTMPAPSTCRNFDPMRIVCQAAQAGTPRPDAARWASGETILTLSDRHRSVHSRWDAQAGHSALARHFCRPCARRLAAPQGLLVQPERRGQQLQRQHGRPRRSAAGDPVPRAAGAAHGRRHADVCTRRGGQVQPRRPVAVWREAAAAAGVIAGV